ncbi:MAG TPA: HPr(Ser) kinase/phosphatase [Thermoanaerobaculaceae bacterium]|nr:HPr(Ser) kinase/phosphatase [Thermoanaerobaculaceae bacterium]HPS78348.1 HPr(Ser) kinase/phosphatase [Thermoanaerobaculaceae bacterium]
MISRPDGVPVERLLQDSRLSHLGLQVVAGSRGLQRPVVNPRLQKPGLGLAGFLTSVKPGRVQVIGSGEADFLATLAPVVAQDRIQGLVALEPPLIAVSKSMEHVVGQFADTCNTYGVPLAMTSATTSLLIERMAAVLELLLAPRQTLHGDLLDVFAIGVLLLGESGSGKSECALELVYRGHRLVADDVVDVFRLRNDDLFGQAPDAVRGLMEVRGLGLISIEQLFGVVAVRDTKPIDLVINLVFGSDGPLERLGLGESTEEILGVRRPSLTFPVAPGRILSLMVESAARKYLLYQRGLPDAAREYLQRHDQELQRP